MDRLHQILVFLLLLLLPHHHLPLLAKISLRPGTVTLALSKNSGANVEELG